MTLPASITTNLFSDFKNVRIGAFPRIVRITQEAGSSGTAVGTVAQEKVASSFIPTETGDLINVEFSLTKTGSPTDNLVVKLCADNAGEPGTVLATSISLPGSTFTTSEVWRKFSFFTPYTIQVSTTYWLLLERTGSVSAVDYYNLWGNTSNVYADGLLKRLIITGWTSSGVIDAKFRISIRASSARYVVAMDKTDNKVRAYKSTDMGNSWSEQDSANAPATIATASQRSCFAVMQDSEIVVFHATTAPGISHPRFNTITDAWVSQLGLSNTLNTSVTGTLPLAGGKFPSGGTYDYWMAFQGATETIMGNARRRIKFRRRAVSGSSWSGVSDVVGSPNTLDTSTLPGTAVDYDLRAVIADANGVVHIFWTQSDDSSVHHRQVNTDGNYSTANLLGTTPAATSNSAAYSLGLPANYYRNDDWNLALPYVDSGAIKVSRCLASGTATASNWTNTTVVASGAETTNSNPAVLIADNEQGGKLFLIYTKTDGKLYYTHDQGSDSWVAEQELHPGTKTVGALSVELLVDAIGIVYLDTAPATDDLKFDSL